MNVFVDASFLIALFHTHDAFHTKAQTTLKKLKQDSFQPIYSNIVLAETTNFLFRLKGPKTASKLFKLIQKSDIQEVPLTKETFEVGYEILFSQKSRKDMGFFDCLHVATMKQSSIDTILTFDSHFKKYVRVYD
ncbi:hypothetical protein COT44_03060 [Candidatus Shapirobacteria bacterium CG08_land_8_20_14_0_20_39_18]|uniref:PIN domain-containing protein n=1 Tax=Candidatus Shapirobacteria bacterium CG08_land_8_20_14_0_20_39_18 TaxID=1974883 RepID=A0A2M6XCJ5_9BACT|nr:MAG: hypothetical protein COT44_03060 [Candidatus Shapirobacteria bacterium CG08_land_8_20_14_0_20_39_18]PIY66495.1 MAG: hypothetical protein COY91_00175 [Candidatus Shapirobacteria bacterium CG_4_10_14_0_8_um_filter_39_15]